MAFVAVLNMGVFRPLFTWWVTSVQVIVCVISLLFYGIGPAGWERVEMKEEVIDVTLVMRQVSYFEPVNLWFGPRFVGFPLVNVTPQSSCLTTVVIQG